jgi:subtilisin family serine protease
MQIAVCTTVADRLSRIESPAGGAEDPMFDGNPSPTRARSPRCATTRGRGESKRLHRAPLVVPLLLIALSLVPCLSPAPARADARLADVDLPRAKDIPQSFDTIVIQVAEQHARVIRAHVGDTNRDAGLTTGLPSLDRLLDITHALELRPVFDLTHEADAKREHGLHRFFAIRFASLTRSEINAARSLFSGHVLVERAETSGIARIMAAPNDQLFADQWAHQNDRQIVAVDERPIGISDCDLKTTKAWSRVDTTRRVTIAFLDTGIDHRHPEFAGRIEPGYDFVNDDHDPSDDHGHGTACAGIAAAQGDNWIGIAGVSWHCRILPLKVLDENGRGGWHWVARGVEHAADRGVQVVSMNLGGEPSMVMEAAVEYAWSRGCVMFAPTGNDDRKYLVFPARYPRVAAVGALSPCFERKAPGSCDGETWWGSNYGPGTDFLAPGVHLVTTDILGREGYTPRDYYRSFNGTSAATAHAAGMAALFLAQLPEISNTAALNRLRMSCTDLGKEGFDSNSGYGLLNADRAVRFRDYDPVEQSWEEDPTVAETAEKVTKAVWGEIDAKVDTKKRVAGVTVLLVLVVASMAIAVKCRPTEKPAAARPKSRPKPRPPFATRPRKPRWSYSGR